MSREKSPSTLDDYMQELKYSWMIADNLFVAGQIDTKSVDDLYTLRNTYNTDSIEYGLITQFIDALEHNDTETLHYLKTLSSRLQGACHALNLFITGDYEKLQKQAKVMRNYVFEVAGTDNHAYMEGFYREAKNLLRD